MERDYCRIAAMAGMLGMGALPGVAAADERALAETMVFFDRQASGLDPAALAALDGLLRRVRAIAPDMIALSGIFGDEGPEVIEVFGHADAADAMPDDRTLSEARAEAVRAYLIVKGVDPNRVRVEGGLPGKERRATTIRLITDR